MRRIGMAERFWSKVRRGDGCWEWVACRFAFGYGRFSVSVARKSVQAHGVAWELTYGEVPLGLFVCHRCDNPPCVNPTHLFLGTVQDNNADRDAKGRAKPGGKPSPGEQNGNAKLTKAEVDEIRSAISGGATQTSLARRFGVSQAHISRISLGRSWGPG